jgi:succinate dehydrogenase / fumarate reductase cytochrome b subunit
MSDVASEIGGEVTTTKQAAPAQVRRRLPWPLEFYRSAVGKKWVMAVTGIILLGYIAAHMIGNFKLYIGAESINSYGEALRDLGGHLAPRTHLLWAMRIGLLAATALHIHAAYSLTVTNWKARGGRYAQRDYAVANYASRTMRWTGVIVAFFVLFHLADLTWGTTPLAVDEFVRGDVYANLVASFSRPVVAVAYMVANAALAVHIFHGTWSLFQSLGWSNPRFNHWRKYAAYAFSGAILLGNLSFPIAVLAGIVE